MLRPGRRRCPRPARRSNGRRCRRSVRRRPGWLHMRTCELRPPRSATGARAATHSRQVVRPVLMPRRAAGVVVDQVQDVHRRPARHGPRPARIARSRAAGGRWQRFGDPDTESWPRPAGRPCGQRSIASGVQRFALDEDQAVLAVAARARGWPAGRTAPAARRAPWPPAPRRTPNRSPAGSSTNAPRRTTRPGPRRRCRPTKRTGRPAPRRRRLPAPRAAKPSLATTRCACGHAPPPLRTPTAPPAAVDRLQPRLANTSRRLRASPAPAAAGRGRTGNTITSRAPSSRMAIGHDLRITGGDRAGPQHTTRERPARRRLRCGATRGCRCPRPNRRCGRATSPAWPARPACRASWWCGGSSRRAPSRSATRPEPAATSATGDVATPARAWCRGRQAAVAAGRHAGAQARREVGRKRGRPL